MHAFADSIPAANWLRERVTGRLCADSRRLSPGDGFLAWPGERFDARSHLPQAWQRGARAVLVEHQGLVVDGDDDRLASFHSLKRHSGAIASAFYGEPSHHLLVLAVTGTNGKTSTAWWLAQALGELPGKPFRTCALIGTLGSGYLPQLQDAGLTTPDAVDLQNALAGFVRDGAGACAMEASSVGLEEHRLEGTRIHTAIFTNLTQDHLDYHGDMAHYGAAKRRLFSWPGLRAAVINVDDAFGAALADSLRQSDAGLDLWTVSAQGGVGSTARLHACETRYHSAGLSFTVQEGDERERVDTELIGQYNVANLMGVIATLRSVGVSLADASAACRQLSPVPGRMQCVRAAGRPLVAVDYAHTPDALAQALQALRPMADERGGRLWCVFGCGGDRDASKRPQMGAIATRWADRVMITSDNPRREPPDAIISQILLGTAGVPSVMVEPDRALAIEETLAVAAPADVVLIAGKGHESYQEIAGERRPFSDESCVRRLWGLSDGPGSPA